MHPIIGIGRIVRENSRFMLLAVLSGGLFAAEHLQGEALEGDDLFRPDDLLEIRIDISEADWTALCGQTRGFGSAFQNPTSKPFTYFKGDISINDVRIDSVGIRKKGFIGSLDDYRPSLKIKFDEYVDQKPIAGLDRLTLNNNKQDSSLVSQFLTYKVFRDAGLHAPRCNFAKVTVNGEYLGIYSNVESYRKPFLKQAFGTAEGTLIEGTLSDFYPKAIGRLEVKNDKSASALDKSVKLAELLAAEGRLNLAEVEAMVDVPYFIKFWAIETLIGFWDGYSNNQNNFFTYDNPKNGKLYFMPWGADGAWGGGRGMFRRIGNVDSIAVYGESMLANRLYWTGETVDQYARIMEDLLETVWNEDRLTAEVDRVERLVRAHLPEYQSEALVAMDDVRDFIAARRPNVVRELDNQPGTFPTTPRKPMYIVDLGTTKGQFETVWHGETGREAPPDGTAALEMVLEKSNVVLTELSSRVEVLRFMGFGPGFGRRGGNQTPPVLIELSGLRKSDSEKITISMMVDRDQFESGVGRELPVQGSFSEGDRGGQGGFGSRGPGRSVTGMLKLSAAGVSEGDAVAGTLDLNIFETRGGMFSRFGRR